MKHCFTIIILTFYLPSFSQWDVKDPIEFQQELDKWYANEETSALPKSEIENFNQLNYFAVNENFVVVANFIPAEKVKKKVFGTSDNQARPMKEIGVLKFKLDGMDCELKVLESVVHYDEEFKDYLTVPFLDNTNGNETYGGGRYLGIWKNDIKNNKVLLNFNLAYNPSCAYSEGYSCLIPPRSKYIKTRVEAGVKTGWQKKSNKN